jgi:transporter family-2 protein
MAATRARSGFGSSERSTAHPVGRTKQVWGVTLALTAGVGMAVQSRVNGQLGHELQDSMLAALVSFGGGLLLLLVALGFSRRMRAGIARVPPALRSGWLRGWQLLGGIAGATYVLGQSVTVVVLGVATFTVGVVAGQTVSGLFVDKAGLGPSGPQPPTWPRVVGAALTVLAVGSAVVGGLLNADVSHLWLLILPLVAGTGMALQQAFNGHVGAVSGSALTAALVNFVAGTSVLVLAWLVALVLRGGPRGWPSNPVLYLGGLVGVGFIAAASFIVSWVGVLMLGLASIAGQLVGSVLMDILVPATGRPLQVSTIAGCGVALVAVAIAGVGGRRRPGITARR